MTKRELAEHIFAERVRGFRSLPTKPREDENLRMALEAVAQYSIFAAEVFYEQQLKEVNKLNERAKNGKPNKS